MYKLSMGLVLGVGACSSVWTHGDPSDPLGSPQVPPMAPVVARRAPVVAHRAPWPALPQVESSGGPVLARPRLVPVFFGDDPDPRAAELATFLVRWTSSPYFAQQLAEYGVGPATVAAPVLLGEAAPQKADATAIAAWLGRRLDPAAAPLLPSSADALYVLYYPAATALTKGRERGCVDFSGFHGEALLRGGPRGGSAAFAVIGRCQAGLDFRTRITAHEVVEAITDPRTATARAYHRLKEPFSLWGAALPGTEIGDLCQRRSDAAYRPADLGFMLQRTWSNAAAAAGRDPCVPVPPGAPAFLAVPELPEQLGVATPAGRQRSAAVRIAAGAARTVDVRLYGAGQLPGPIAVAAREDPPGAGRLWFAWDRPSGAAGETLRLTIGRPADGADEAGFASFVVQAAVGPAQTYWIGAVSFN